MSAAVIAGLAALGYAIYRYANHEVVDPYARAVSATRITEKHPSGGMFADLVTSMPHVIDMSGNATPVDLREIAKRLVGMRMFEAQSVLRSIHGATYRVVYPGEAITQDINPKRITIALEARPLGIVNDARIVAAGVG